MCADCDYRKHHAHPRNVLCDRLLSHHRPTNISLAFDAYLTWPFWRTPVTLCADCGAASTRLFNVSVFGPPVSRELMLPEAGEEG